MVKILKMVNSKTSSSFQQKTSGAQLKRPNAMGFATDLPIFLSLGSPTTYGKMQGFLL